MMTQDLVLLIACPVVLAGCFLAKYIAVKQRKRYAAMLKEDERIMQMAFGPMCRCGHRLSMHVSKYDPSSASGNWCRHENCKCGDYRGEEG